MKSKKPAEAKKTVAKKAVAKKAVAKKAVAKKAVARIAATPTRAPGKRGDLVGEAIRDLVHAEAGTRLGALVSLNGLAADMTDVRDAQSLIVWLLLHDPSLEVRIAAAELTDFRASEGHDVGFAVPACLVLVSREDTPARLRELAAATLRSAEPRTPTRALFST